MVNLKARPFYLNDEDIKWVNDTIDSMSDEEINARPMTPVTRNRIVSKSLRAYASMVSSADKGGVRIID